MIILPVRTINPYITNPYLKGGTIEESVIVKDKSSNLTKLPTTTIRNKVKLKLTK